MKSFILALVIILNPTSVIAGTVTEMNIQQFHKTLSNDKQNKLLFFYTSWCTHCKPVTLATGLQPGKILFISVDTEQEAIDEFAKLMHYDTIYIQPTEKMSNLVELSTKLRIKFMVMDKEGNVDSHVPYIAYLDGDNKVIKDDIPIEDLYGYLQ